MLDRITTDEELEWLRATYDDVRRSSAVPASPTRVFDVARPYGSLDEPDLGQLLFPERRIARRCATR